MKSVYQSCAYVIHIRPYRNTSALIDFFTKEQGMIRAVVNGVYGQNKKQLHWKGLLQSFKYLTIRWKGDGGLKTLIEVEPRNKNSSEQPKGLHLYCGFYVNELLKNCLSGQEVDEFLFDAYDQCISALLNEQDMQIYLRTFESQLLQSLGYALNFKQDFLGDEIVESEWYVFDALQGFQKSIENVPYAILGEHLLCLAEGDLSQQKTKNIAKYVFRQSLEVHAGVGALKSRDLFSSI